MKILFTSTYSILEQGFSNEEKDKGSSSGGWITPLNTHSNIFPVI